MIGLVDGDVFVYLAYWGKENFEDARDHAEEMIQNCKEENFCDYLAIAVGGDYNFRDDFYVDYKKSTGRANSRKTLPDWIPDLKAYIGNRDDAVITEYNEADDLVRIWAEQCKAANKDYVIITHDKDLDCIDGKHFNPKKWESYVVDEDQADYSYWKQLLMGDSIDNIPGIKGIGPKKADKILEGLALKEERKAAVCKEYYTAYNSEGYANLVANGRLLHIMRHNYDYFKLSKEDYDKSIGN